LLATNSSVALHIPSDEVLPPNGISQQDLVTFVGDLYNFAVRPQAHPAIFQPVLVFQSGKAAIGQNIYPISQLSVVANGDIVTASTTTIAEEILNDFMDKLDTGLGYRMRASVGRLTYVSNMIVEFDHPLETRGSTFGVIEKIIQNTTKHPEPPFKLKRLAFGFGDPAPSQAITLEGVDNADFILERRAGEPYSKNRYYCSAPLKTEDHLKVLAEIEKILKR
jgi:hypothetical protein